MSGRLIVCVGNLVQDEVFEVEALPSAGIKTGDTIIKVGGDEISDPRDLATSLYLSHFQPGQQIWTTSPDSIRRTIELSQRVMPRLLEVLGIPHVSVLYEDLVEDPARDARRALALLGLEMDDAVLSPEQNTRAAMTQSVAQVRRPINRTSVGRWKNYAFAFDASWEAVVAEHERRRAHARGAT